MTRPGMPIKTSLISRGRRAGGSGEPASDPVPPTLGVGEPWLLDSREVAGLLRISRTTAFQLMGRGDVPVVRIGRCIRVPRQALATWVNDQTRSVTRGPWRISEMYVDS